MLPARANTQSVISYSVLQNVRRPNTFASPSLFVFSRGLSLCVFCVYFSVFVRHDVIQSNQHSYVLHVRRSSCNIPWYRERACAGTWQIRKALVCSIYVITAVGGAAKSCPAVCCIYGQVLCQPAALQPLVLGPVHSFPRCIAPPLSNLCRRSSRFICERATTSETTSGAAAVL